MGRNKRWGTERERKEGDMGLEINRKRREKDRGGEKERGN
jgi:hypothetical protein